MKRSDPELPNLLSLERTYLSIERTLLAYIRTFVGLLAAGAALVKLFDVAWARSSGIALLIISPVVLLFGFWRFVHIHAKLKRYGSFGPEADEDEDED